MHADPPVHISRISTNVRQNVVPPCALTIHTEAATSAFHSLDERKRSELTILLGYYDPRGAVVRESLLENINRMTGKPALY